MPVLCPLVRERSRVQFSLAAPPKQQEMPAGFPVGMSAKGRGTWRIDPCAIRAHRDLRASGIVGEVPKVARNPCAAIGRPLTIEMGGNVGRGGRDVPTRRG